MHAPCIRTRTHKHIRTYIYTCLCLRFSVPGVGVPALAHAMLRSLLFRRRAPSAASASGRSTRVRRAHTMAGCFVNRTTLRCSRPLARPTRRYATLFVLPVSLSVFFFFFFFFFCFAFFFLCVSRVFVFALCVAHQAAPLVDQCALSSFVAWF